MINTSKTVNQNYSNFRKPIAKQDPALILKSESNVIKKLDIDQSLVKRYVPKKKNHAVPPLKKEIKRKNVSKKIVEEVVHEPIIIRHIQKQNDEAERIVECYKKYPTYLETATPGSGKTVLGMLVAKILGLPVFIVAQSKLLNHWKRYAEAMDVEIRYSISYGKLCGRSGTSNNIILTREDIIGKKIKTNFTTTPEYEEMLLEGVLLIFDECSMVKNKSADQTKACRAISRKLTFMNNSVEDFKSRSLFISGTPITEIIQIVDFVKTIGFINSDKFFKFANKNGKKSIEFTGIKPLINVCSDIDYEQTNYIVSHIYSDQTSINLIKIIVSLYVEVLKHVISGGMKSSKIEGYKFDVKNKFYNMEHDDFLKLKESIEELVRQTGYDDKTSTFAKTGIKNKKIGAKSIRKKCNEYKIPILLRECRRVFNKYPREKIIIATEYVTDITNVLKRELSEYGSEVVEGSVPLQERERIVDLFNENNDKCRILIISRSGYHGISIHDKHGGYRHRMYILPDFSMENQFQASYRGYREGVKSDFKVRNVFVKGLDIELRVIASSERQSGCAKLMLDKDTIENSVFPDDYEDKIEGEKTDVNFKVRRNANKFETYSLYKMN